MSGGLIPSEELKLIHEPQTTSLLTRRMASKGELEARAAGSLNNGGS